MKQKIIKVKVGEVYADGKTFPVFKTFWKKESKAGKIYYESKEVAFPSEVETKETSKVVTSKIDI